MVKHIVTFKLSGTAEERRAVAERFRDALLALPAQIEVLRSMEVGINENPSEDWDVVLTAVVPDMESVEVYAKHPAHVAAASILAGHKESRACVDYCFSLIQDIRQTSKTADCHTVAVCRFGLCFIFTKSKSCPKA